MRNSGGGGGGGGGRGCEESKGEWGTCVQLYKKRRQDYDVSQKKRPRGGCRCSYCCRESERDGQQLQPAAAPWKEKLEAIERARVAQDAFEDW